MDFGDITDPSDWKLTKTPFLTDVECFLQCHICKEFLTAPMMTSCGHTFCSLCIRRSLNNERICPICRMEQGEEQLRKNDLIEDIVFVFNKNRKVLMEIVKKDDVEMETEEKKDIITYDVGTETNDTIASRTKRKRNITNEEYVIVESDDDEQLEEVKSKKTKTSSKFFTSNTNDTNASNEEEIESECPICGELYPIRILQTIHIDKCLSNSKTPIPSSQKKQQSSFFISHKRSQNININQSRLTTTTKHLEKMNISKNKKKLPKITYSLFKDSKLKSKLQELNLSIIGTRLELEERHSYWVSLWNSNLDSKNPINEIELKNKLYLWERDKLRSLNQRLKKQDVKNISDKEWKKTYEDDFLNLVEKAKNSIKKSTSLETEYEDLSKYESNNESKEELKEKSENLLKNEDLSNK